VQCTVSDRPGHGSRLGPQLAEIEVLRDTLGGPPHHNAPTGAGFFVQPIDLESDIRAACQLRQHAVRHSPEDDGFVVVGVIDRDQFGTVRRVPRHPADCVLTQQPLARSARNLSERGILALVPVVDDIDSSFADRAPLKRGRSSPPGYRDEGRRAVRETDPQFSIVGGSLP